MGRKIVTLFTDDYSKTDIPEESAKKVVLRFGMDEYTLILTEESEAAIKGILAPIVDTADHKDLTPKWKQDQTPTTTPNRSGLSLVTIAPENKILREWWASLTKPQLKVCGLNAPNGNRGRVPNAVKDAYVSAHSAASNE